MPVPPINEFDNPLFSDPGLGSEGGVRPMPLPMPVKGQPKRPIKGPPPKRISDPIKVPPRTIMPVKGPRLPIKTSPPKIRPMPAPIVAPLPRVISDPVRPKPAPITRGVGGIRRPSIRRGR